jgi:hypothetical protein
MPSVDYVGALMTVLRACDSLKLTGDTKERRANLTDNTATTPTSRAIPQFAPRGSSDVG